MCVLCVCAPMRCEFQQSRQQQRNARSATEKYGLKNRHLCVLLIVDCFFFASAAAFVVAVWNSFKGCFQQSFSIYNHNYYLHESVFFPIAISFLLKINATRLNANGQLSSLYSFSLHYASAFLRSVCTHLIL